MKFLKLLPAILICFAIAFSSCNLSKTTKGAGVGVIAGGAIGGLIGHKAGNTAVGVLIGAGIGGTAGALLGRKMDKQAEELKRDLDGATVQRIGEGILITFNEGLQFNVNSSDVQSNSIQNLSDLSEILEKYPDTNILIEGHTDSDGTDEHNQNLSIQRASAVQKSLIDTGIPITRISTIGYGETQPLADNGTQEGKQQNRRVEIAIYANDKMIKMAKKGELE